MQKFSIGKSSDCDIIVQGQYISRHHAILIIDGRNVFIEDNGSTNGTYVDGRKIQSRTRLNSNSKVTLGRQDAFEWYKYIPTIFDNEEGTVLDTNEYKNSHRYETPSPPPQYNQPLIEIPSKMEINQNYAEVYRNGEQGADWKVPMKRNIGNAVCKTLGCIISILIVVAVIALLTLL